MKKIVAAVMFLSLSTGLWPAFAADRGVVVTGKATAAVIEKERRTALVIGNSAYVTSPLKNPANDATTMAKTLRDLGFSVDERTNLGMTDMKQAIEAFGRSLKSGGVGLFFYAGHGMQVEGQNYLVPVDADIQGEAEVDYKAVNAGLVLAKMDMAKNSMNIVILDACRNNPFARSFRAINPGLASMNAPSGTLIAYATAPGSVASDGTGANGLYTQAVVKTIRKPGLRIEDAFKQVRSSVQSQTQGKQVPWESSSLVGDFYFAGKPEGGIDTSRLEGLAEGSKERRAELERLKKLEAENAKQKQKEQAEIEKREKEIAALDAQITSMKSRLGTVAEIQGDSLENMVAIVERKEEEGRQLDELRAQRRAEEEKRQEEITRLREEAEINRRTRIEKDIAHYEKIIGSSYGKDMAQQAWQALRSKYPEAKGTVFANTNELREFLINGILPEGETARRKAGTEGNRKAEIEKDIAAYETALGSTRGNENASTAWQALLSKYPAAKGMVFANTNELRKFLMSGIIPEGEISKQNGEPERKQQPATVESNDLVFVKGGCFQMGDAFGDGYDDEKPMHEVCVDDFSIGKYEVTQAQWEAVTGKNPSHFERCGGNCPVEQVTWNDAQEYIRILNQRTGKTYRLPTEAEWEYAARSGGKREEYAGGGDLDSAAWYSANSGSRTHPVGQKRPNGLGLYDMSGNVWEWVEDVYNNAAYSLHSRNNPLYSGSGALKVIRGGGWHNAPRRVRSANRDYVAPGGRLDDLGFRLARTK